jgi:NADH:ubiquinone oxidoreductase subunit B-like Fe-S oxidoreductase
MFYGTQAGGSLGLKKSVYNVTYLVTCCTFEIAAQTTFVGQHRLPRDGPWG